MRDSVYSRSVHGRGNERGEPVRVAVVLAGGAGTRLRAVTGDSLAKPAVPVMGRPFIDYVLSSLERAGVARVYLSLGHRADTVIAALQQLGSTRIDWRPCVEKEPRGTAGALALLMDTLPDRFLVVNGDTLVHGLDVAALVRFHTANHSVLTSAVTRVESSSQCGSVVLDKESRMKGFLEKARSGRGLVNCGFYVMNKIVLREIPSAVPYSIEKDLIPKMLAEGAKVYGFPFEGSFYDIGTPERLGRFARYVEQTRNVDNREGSRPT